MGLGALGKAIRMSFIINDLAVNFSTGTKPWKISDLRITSDNGENGLWKTKTFCVKARFGSNL